MLQRMEFRIFGPGQGVITVADEMVTVARENCGELRERRSDGNGTLLTFDLKERGPRDSFLAEIPNLTRYYPGVRVERTKRLDI